jgi:hypothetical protein
LVTRATAQISPYSIQRGSVGEELLYFVTAPAGPAHSRLRSGAGVRPRRDQPNKNERLVEQLSRCENPVPLTLDDSASTRSVKGASRRCAITARSNKFDP